LRKAALLKDAARAACEEVGERCHVFRQVHFGVGSAIKSRPVELNVEVVDYYLSQCDRWTLTENLQVHCNFKSSK
jgi:hypothetical protein